MNSFLRVLGATVAFWVCLLLSPAVIYFLNYISFIMTGGAQGIIYKISLFFIPAIAAGVAYVVSYTVSKKGVTAFTNSIVAIVLYATSAVYDFGWENYSKVAIDVILVITFLVFAVFDRLGVLEDIVE